MVSFRNLQVDQVKASLVPRPPLFFVLQFAFSIIHGSGRTVKNGEGLGTPITSMTSGGREVDVGGAVPIYKFVCNKP